MWAGRHVLLCGAGNAFVQSTVVEILCCGNVGMKERRKDRKAPPQLLFLTNDGTVHTRRAFTFETGRHRSYLATHSSFENICGAYSGIYRQSSYHNDDKEVGKDVHIFYRPFLSPNGAEHTVPPCACTRTRIHHSTPCHIARTCV